MSMKESGVSGTRTSSSNPLQERRHLKRAGRAVGERPPLSGQNSAYLQQFLHLKGGANLYQHSRLLLTRIG